MKEEMHGHDSGNWLVADAGLASGQFPWCRSEREPVLSLRIQAPTPLKGGHCKQTLESSLCYEFRPTGESELE